MSPDFADTASRTGSADVRPDVEVPLAAMQDKIEEAIDVVEQLAQAARAAAAEFDRDAPELAGAVRTAADGADGFAAGIRQLSLDDVLTSATRMARRQPFMAVMAAFVIGLAISMAAGVQGRDRLSRSKPLR